MAGERSNKRTKDKWKEKKWYRIMAPSQLGGKEIAMTVGTGPDSIKGRVVEIPISDFSGNFKKSNAKLEFKVLDCVGTKCSTIFVGHSVNDDYIRRMVRRRRERLDIVTDVKTSDLYNVAVKLVLVADQKLTGTKRSEIRSTAVDYILNKAKEMDLGTFANYVIGDAVYGDFVNSLKDVYPIKKIEVRKTEIGKRDEVPDKEQEPVEAVPN